MSDGPRSWVVIYLKGFCMGLADAVPGVSGGTIALITGIYERLIDAITEVTLGRIVDVLSGVRPANRERAWSALREMDALFVVTLVLGIFSAILTITSAVDFAVEAYPVPTFGFFLGLIAASAVVLRSAVRVDTPGRVAAGIAGFSMAFLVSGAATAGLGHSPVVTFLTGTVAISAMILPGLSGSLLLLILGQYTYMTGTLTDLRIAVTDLVSGGSIDAVVEPAATAIVFIAGALLGLFTIAHAVRYALETYRRATLVFLVSLIVGALRAPVLRIETELAATGQTWTPDVLVIVAGPALVGAGLVVTLEYVADGVAY
ncbi:MAG: DUF368 domain-containing protein [Halobacteriota archaeon]